MSLRANQNRIYRKDGSHHRYRWSDPFRLTQPSPSTTSFSSSSSSSCPSLGATESPSYYSPETADGSPRRFTYKASDLPAKGHFKESGPSNASSSASVDTYDSLGSAEEGDEIFDSQDELPSPTSMDDRIPAVLPVYRPPIPDHSVRPSNQQAFGRLFPSLDRLSIRHDDSTPDGNMNLRVDVMVPSSSRFRGTVTMQLFHLRMHDLAYRDFSLRRYCRDSGREVCTSKRAFADPSAFKRRPSISHSLSSAVRAFKSPRVRKESFSTVGDARSRPSTGYAESASSQGSSSFSSTRRDIAALLSLKKTSPKRLRATEIIKLEFTNYARVQVSRKSTKGYEFDWWGHQYTWQRVVDKTLGLVSFHLVRDHRAEAVAHIVPETRSPNQVFDEELAGGWIPPCHMWISDATVLDAVTDVADVIVATGLICLVDDCIKQRWQVKKARRLSHVGTESKKLMEALFHRRYSYTPQHVPPQRSNLSHSAVA